MRSPSTDNQKNGHVFIISTGRSIIFASWDGEEFGALGSTDWLSRHSREMDSRAVAYINLDEMMQGVERFHVVGSPLLE